MDKERIELGISLNSHCNFRCKMCYIWNQDRGENRLNLERCCKMVDELEKFDVKGVRLSGGDPLLTPWALDLAKYSAGIGYHTIATTNGSMITEALAKKIVDSSMHSLNLSLDSSTPEVHDSIRGFPGSYEKIIDAVDYLTCQSNGLKIGINTVISKLNLDEIIPLTEMVQEDKRINHIYFMAVMQPFGTRPDREWFLRDEFRFLWPQAEDRVSSVLEQLIHLRQDGYKINNSISQLRTFCDYFTNPLSFTKKNTCNLGKEVIEVNQLGDVYLCYYYECIGSIFNDNLYDIWNSEKAIHVREKINNCRRNCNLLINCYFEDEDV